MTYLAALREVDEEEQVEEMVEEEHEHEHGEDDEDEEREDEEDEDEDEEEDAEQSEDEDEEEQWPRGLRVVARSFMDDEPVDYLNTPD